MVRLTNTDSTDAQFNYDKSWEQIEEMLAKARKKQKKWRAWFEQCKRDGDREGMKEAARNHKALEGVIKTLRWTLGESGLSSPLE